MKKTITLSALAMLLAMPVSALGIYDADTTQTDTTSQAKAGKAKGSDKSKTDKKAKKLTPYEQLIKKGGTEHKGLMTVRHIDNKWYFEVPDSLLGRYILAVTRFASVPQEFGKYAGEEVNEWTLYWEQRDKETLILRAYLPTHVATQGSKISETLATSTVDPIIGAYKVIGRNKKTKAQLVEVTPLFTKDNNIVGIGNRTKELKLGGLQADRSFVDTMKVFPQNIEILSTRTYAATPSKARASLSGQMTLRLNTSMVLLPKVPMQRRLWDKRVGYFNKPVTYFTDEQHKTSHEQMISRYRLVPKDIKKYQKGILTEPVKPIVYYIDPATPKQWVPYLMAGINDWNVAFEAAGFKNAIQAREWPNDPDMSVDDARFCVLRYLPAEIENAYGPRIVDPRSGEIMESHICWYHNVMSLLTKWYMIQAGPLDKRAQTMHFDEELMGQLIRFVSSHEVGHTLGLRHNMGASHATPVEKLRDKKWVEEHGHTASIMDYARFNYVAQPEDGISEKGLFPRINDYDKWAIKWGYQYRPEFDDEFAEKEALMTETSEVLASNPRLWFGGEGKDEDPRAQTEDLGSDNVKASDLGIRNLKRVVEGLPKWTAQTNGRTTDLVDMWQAAKGQFRRYTNHVLKNVGGRYLNNTPGRKAYEVAPAAKQRAAVDYISRQLFTAPTWLYPQVVLDANGLDMASDISAEQKRVLSLLLGVANLSAIYTQQTSSPQAYQLEQYLSDVFASVWKPLTTGVDGQLRRQLQRSYVDRLNSLLNPTDKEKSGIAAKVTDSDVRLYIEQHLDLVSQHCTKQQATASGVNKLHYADMLRQIKLIRERMVTVGK